MIKSVFGDFPLDAFADCHVHNKTMSALKTCFDLTFTNKTYRKRWSDNEFFFKDQNHMNTPSSIFKDPEAHFDFFIIYICSLHFLINFRVWTHWNRNQRDRTFYITFPTITTHFFKTVFDVYAQKMSWNIYQFSKLIFVKGCFCKFRLNLIRTNKSIKFLVLKYTNSWSTYWNPNPRMMFSLIE